MSLRHHEIAEADHRILNPFTEEKLMLLGAVCRLQPGQRLLDLACGKGELLARWAQTFGIRGHGIDLSEVFLTAARARAEELGVAAQITFEAGDAGKAEPEAGAFDVVSCIGATWIGGGLRGTLALMRRSLRPGGLLLAGEPYWVTAPPPEAYESLHVRPEQFTTLHGTCERLAGAGVTLVEMVLADQDSWDRYMAGQWWTIDEWLRANPGHAEAGAMRRYLEDARSSYLRFGRQYLGWGVFVGRATDTSADTSA